MAQLTARYADYVITIGDGGKVSIEKAGTACASAMGAIREIASATGFALDPKWNTQSSGKKLVAFLNSGETPAPKVVEKAPAPAPAPSAPAAESKPEPLPAKAKEPVTAKKPATPADEDTITLTPEEMNRILKRLDNLEDRINKLSASKSCVSATGASSDGKISVVRSYRVPSVNIFKYDETGKESRNSIFSLSSKEVHLTSDGRFIFQEYNRIGRTSDTNSTTPGSLREIAAGLGLTVDKDAKKLTVAMEIINHFGQFVNGMYIAANGDACTYCDFGFEEYVGALTNKDLLANQFTNEPMKVNPQWSKEELLLEIIRYIGSLNSKYAYGSGW